MLPRIAWIVTIESGVLLNLPVRWIIVPCVCVGTRRWGFDLNLTVTGKVCLFHQHISVVNMHQKKNECVLFKKLSLSRLSRTFIMIDCWILTWIKLRSMLIFTCFYYCSDQDLRLGVDLLCDWMDTARRFFVWLCIDRAWSQSWKRMDVFRWVLAIFELYMMC